MMNSSIKKNNSNSKNEEEEEIDEEEVMLPGFRFHPTDEELVGFYLRRKVDNKPLSIELIKQLDIYKYEPWDLPRVSTLGDKEWYFFCIRGRKYRNSARPNRVTGNGFWKATGIDKPVYSSNAATAHECIGLKKSLVYYRGSAGKGSKTDWMMHEFRLPPPTSRIVSSIHPNHKISVVTSPEAEVWTLCRILKRNRKYISDWRKTTTTNNTNNNTNIKKQINPNNNNNMINDASSKTCSNESNQSHHNNIITNPTHFAAAAAAAQQQQQQCNLIINNNNNNNNEVMINYVEDDQLSTFWNSNSCTDQQFLGDGNWDELRSVVEFATDPSHLINDCI